MTILNKRFENASFDNFIPKTNAQQALVDYLKQGVEKSFTNNVIIIGAVGIGKTHLCFAILNSLAEKKEYSGIVWYDDNKVIYTSIKGIIDSIRKAWEDDTAPLERLNKVPLLIIDEVGVQYGSESEKIELYELFNTRWNNMLPVIAISNLDEKQIQRVLGQRIYDRLADDAYIFNLGGKSQREKKKVISD